MGCWNRDQEPRTTVANAISNNPIKTLILGGDNVYPEKIRISTSTDFTKVYSLKTLMNGVHMLSGKDIYAALGNHNIGGPMLNTQLGLSEWTMPARYYCINFNDYSLIVIDSNLESDEYSVMYKWLSDKIKELNTHKKQYYYVQHEPFIAFKKKKKFVFPKLELLTILTEYPPIAILCADTHNFQEGIIQINDVKIPQFVVGTGGADPDFVSTPIGSTHTVDEISYTMNKYEPGYGYLQVTPDETKFIKVSNWRSFEGKGGKHKKNKKTYKTYKRKINSCRKSRKNTRK
jgi:hypothetical protein